MSGLGIIAKKMGYNVSGSDISKNYIAEKLLKEKIDIKFYHNKKNISQDIDLVVISSAIKDDNPEIIRAKELNIPIIKRAKFLAILSENSKNIIVCGSHGKTTTTSMITSIFEEAQLKYTSVIGGISKHIDSNIKFDHSNEYFIIEADESDGSFLYYKPLVACATNIDNEHLDFYKNIKNIKIAFAKFINKIPSYGTAVLCGDDKNIIDILPYITSPYYTYGFKPENIWQIKNTNYNNTTFDIHYKKNKEATVKLNVFGKHNILNATASYIAARFIGIDKNTILNGILKFSGVKRRLDLIGKINGTIFYDDYAHHPNEIKSTISALKQRYPSRRLIAIFQPHRYSRTKILFKDFLKSFDMIDKLYITEIYSAGESEKGITSDKLIIELRKKGIDVEKYTNTLNVLKNIKEKDIVISLGAGDVYNIINELKIKYELLK